MKNLLSTDERLRELRLRAAVPAFLCTLVLSFCYSLCLILAKAGFLHLSPSQNALLSALPWGGGIIFYLFSILRNGHSHAIRDEVNAQPGRKNSFLLMLVSGCIFGGLSLFLVFFALDGKSFAVSFMLSTGFSLVYGLGMYYVQLRRIKNEEE